LSTGIGSLSSLMPALLIVLINSPEFPFAGIVDISLCDGFQALLCPRLYRSDRQWPNEVNGVLALRERGIIFQHSFAGLRPNSRRFASRWQWQHAREPVWSGALPRNTAQLHQNRER
jgi:hypothetical protein